MGPPDEHRVLVALVFAGEGDILVALNLCRDIQVLDDHVLLLGQPCGG